MPLSFTETSRGWGHSCGRESAFSHAQRIDHAVTGMSVLTQKDSLDTLRVSPGHVSARGPAKSSGPGERPGA